MYNFENYLYHPVLSLLSGLVLILSITSFGFFFIKIFFGEFVKYQKSFFLNAPLIGSNLLILILTPIVYLELHNFNLFRILSIFLVIFFILTIFFYKFKLKKIILEKRNFLLYVILILLFFLCISPVTQADSLAYHMLGGVNFLIKGSLLKDLLPAEIKLVGSGELLIALGLSIGSEQFGTLVQFSSISSIYYVFTSINKNNISKLIFLGVVTTPMFLFLISSPKPQLMQITNILLCSYLTFKLYKNQIPKNLINSFVFLIILLLSLNVLVKFSFILTSTMVGICLFFILFKKKKTYLIFIPILISLIVLFLPKFIFYNNYFDTKLILFFQSSLPINLDLYNNIHKSLSSISAGSRILPIWLVIPIDLGHGGTIIGPMIFSFLIFKIAKNKENLIIFSLIIIFIIVILSFGQATSRFIFEGFIITQLFLLLNKTRSNFHLNIFKYYIYFQSFIAIILLIYSVINLTPGAFSNEARLKVMTNNANGYEASRWINENLKTGEQIFMSHRSIALLNNPSYSLVFLSYLDKNDINLIDYINFLKENDVRKAFIFDNFESGIFSNCLKEKINTINNIHIDFGRNPLKTKSKKNAYIYKVDLKNLENCLGR